MKIFRLERDPALIGWEELMNTTVIAPNELEARMKAYVHFKDICEEYAHELLDPVKCEAIEVTFTNGVIAVEYKTA